MTRQQANAELADILTYIIELNPDMRFGQILQNYGFIIRDDDGSWSNGFYLEPQILLKRVRESLEQSNLT